MKLWIVSIFVLIIVGFSTIGLFLLKNNNNDSSIEKKGKNCSSAEIVNLKIQIVSAKIGTAGAPQAISNLPDNILGSSCFPKQLTDFYTSQVLPVRECFDLNDQKNKEWNENFKKENSGSVERGGDPPGWYEFQKTRPICDQKKYDQFDNLVSEFIQSSL